MTPQAQEDIREAFLYIQARSPENAERWLRRLYGAIERLETLPERCPWARERAYLGEPLRQMVFHSHRLIFEVHRAARGVTVLHFRHTKQRAIGEPPSDD